MRTLLTVGALALFGLIEPAAAQMCGPGQQAQASTSAQGGMCGMNMRADDPMADKPAQPQQQSGMCPCCRNMAMMHGGMQGQGQGGQPGPGGHQGMPGMNPN